MSTIIQLIALINSFSRHIKIKLRGSMSTIIQLIALINSFSRHIIKLWHVSHNYLLGCQMVQLDHFLESNMAAN